MTSRHGRHLTAPLRRLALAVVRGVVDLRSPLYAALLPPVTVARCPLCEQVAAVKLDPWSISSHCWRSGSHQRDTHAACEHLVARSRCVNLRVAPPLRPPISDNDTIILGPRAPYVVPMNLRIDGMRCVLGCTTVFADDCPCYWASYFHPDPDTIEPVDGKWSVSLWNAMADQEKRDELWFGCKVWHDDRDFDLDAWSDQLQWLSSDGRLEDDLAACPFRPRAGATARYAIVRGEVRPWPWSSGRVADDY